MGHRKNRKRERRNGWQGGNDALATASPPDSDWLLLHDDLDPFDAVFAASTPQVDTRKLCGACREFIEDREGGRGTCLHPGSGILSPWTDTAACDFYAGRGRR